MEKSIYLLAAIDPLGVSYDSTLAFAVFDYFPVFYVVGP